MVDLARIHAALTSTYHSLIFLSASECPPSLITALRLRFPEIAPDEWPLRLQWGGTYVNGKEVHEDLPLSPPCRIEYFDPRFSIRNPHDTFPAFEKAWIIFEDEEILVCYKPATLPCLPTREQKIFTLKTYLEEYLNSQGSGYSLHMPSRLDTSVSGLVLTSKSRRMHAALQRSFERRSVQKFYLIEVADKVLWDEQSVDSAIDRDLRHAILRRTVSTGGKAALTKFSRKAYSTFSSSSGTTHATTILEAKPITGRTHQIRVHSQSLGLPIIGDNFYGGLEAPELHMLSYRIMFFHPHAHTSIEVKLPSSLLPKWLPPETLT